MLAQFQACSIQLFSTVAEDLYQLKHHPDYIPLHPHATNITTPVHTALAISNSSKIDLCVPIHDTHTHTGCLET